jgi:hypothetical protein
MSIRECTHPTVISVRGVQHCDARCDRHTKKSQQLGHRLREAALNVDPLRAFELQWPILWFDRLKNQRHDDLLKPICTTQFSWAPA